MEKMLLIFIFLLISPSSFAQTAVTDIMNEKTQSSSLLPTNEQTPIMTQSPIITEKGFVYFQDGRLCKNCTVEKNNISQILRVVDKQGNVWFDITKMPYQTIIIDKHPYARKFGQGVGTWARDMQEQEAKRQEREAAREAKRFNVNCNSFNYGSGSSTNCYSY